MFLNLTLKRRLGAMMIFPINVSRFVHHGKHCSENISKATFRVGSMHTCFPDYTHAGNDLKFGRANVFPTVVCCTEHSKD